MPGNNFDSETQAYFDTLPKNIQQTVIMSDVKINNVSELKAIVEGFTGKNNEA